MFLQSTEKERSVRYVRPLRQLTTRLPCANGGNPPEVSLPVHVDLGKGTPYRPLALPPAGFVLTNPVSELLVV
ncbi:MAG: hypothetical protein A3H69_03270 [Candidatus Sungbacteria bacterium RIFCSPLOWO2_02_FULL_47_9]|nr:MAG: hypothetical protein A3H69_03270 [Candidatus Sungbacteria bacterium RIFCSPLOWO2_02_FULL_47_9]